MAVPSFSLIFPHFPADQASVLFNKIRSSSLHALSVASLLDHTAGGYYSPRRLFTYHLGNITLTLYQ